MTWHSFTFLMTFHISGLSSWMARFLTMVIPSFNIWGECQGIVGSDCATCSVLRWCVQSKLWLWFWAASILSFLLLSVHIWILYKFIQEAFPHLANLPEVFPKFQPFSCQINLKLLTLVMSGTLLPSANYAGTESIPIWIISIFPAQLKC